MENKKQYKESYKSTVNTPAYKPKRGKLASLMTEDAMKHGTDPVS